MACEADRDQYPYGYFADPATKKPIDEFKSLKIEHGPPRKRFWFVSIPNLKLQEDLLFVDPKGNEWEVKAGFSFNGGSIPWWAWWLCYPTQPECLTAFCIHDKLCVTHECNSIIAAYVFWCAMRANGYYRLGAFRNWFCVFHFGPAF